MKSLIYLRFFIMSSHFSLTIIKNPGFLHHLHSVLLLITEKSGNCLLSINITQGRYGEKYSKMDQVKFVEESL